MTRQNQLRALRDTWRTEAEHRLIVLGYSLPDQDFPNEKKQHYERFFNRADEFAEHKWDSLKPRIIKLLEDEAKKRTERQRRERRYERESQIRELLSRLLEQLAVAIPEGFDELSLTQRTILLANWLPLPKASAVLEWSMFDGWAGSEVFVEAITERFNTQREDITQLVLDWGKRAKGELVAILREGREKHGLAIDWSQDALPIVGGEGQGSGDMVDADSSLLLRADSLFTYKGYSRVWSYPEIIQDFYMDYDFDPASFKFHPEASSTAQALLTFLGRANASSLELTGERFSCGACYSYKMCLISAVMHYMEMSELWQSIQQSLPNFSALGIAYNNTHDLSSHTSRPVFLQLSPQEVTDITAKFNRLDKMLSWDEQAVEELGASLPANNSSIVPSESEGANANQGEDVGEGGSDGESINEDESDDEPMLWERNRFVCKLCEQAQLESKLYAFIFIPQMFDHLRNVHDISDPEHGLDVTDRESIKNSPYIRLAGKFERLTWGWTMGMQPGGDGH